MKPRALIVDDEPLARQRVEDLLVEDGRFIIAGRSGDGLQAATDILALRPDLVLLDVQMPGMDGFEVLEAVAPESLPAVLFITSYDQYALRAFEAQALDYLLKPFDGERFRRALDRALEWLTPPGPGLDEGRLRSLLTEVAQHRPYPQRILGKAGDRMILVPSASIQWVEAENNYVRLHTAEGSSLVRQTMEGMLSRLDPDRFRRIHRSHIVNLDFIQELQPWFSGDVLVLLRDGTRLTLSRTYRHQVEGL